MDEVKADKELENMEYAGFKENAEIKAIIAGQKAKKNFIQMGDVKIQIKASIPKPMRDKITSIVKAYRNEDTDVGDREMYVTIASLCLDEPYTNPAVWQYIDEETGEVPNVLKNILEKIMHVEGAAASFRP